MHKEVKMAKPENKAEKKENKKGCCSGNAKGKK